MSAQTFLPEGENTYIVTDNNKLVRVTRHDDPTIRRSRRFFIVVFCLLVAIGAIYSPTVISFVLWFICAYVVSRVIMLLRYLLPWKYPAIFTFRGMRKRYYRSQRLLERARAGLVDYPFILYLRPFWSEDSRASFIAQRTTGIIPPEERRFQLGSIVEKIIPDDQVLLRIYDAVGGDVNGADIKLDTKDWQARIRDFIRGSQQIIYMPGLSDNVLWEFSCIIEEKALPKLTIIMQFGNEPDEGEQALWDEIKAEFHKYEISLPDYNREGMLIKLGYNGMVLDSVPIVGTPFEKLWKFITSPSGCRALEVSS